MYIKAYMYNMYTLNKICLNYSNNKHHFTNTNQWYMTYECNSEFLYTIYYDFLISDLSYGWHVHVTRVTRVTHCNYSYLIIITVIFKVLINKCTDLSYRYVLECDLVSRNILPCFYFISCANKPCYLYFYK